MPSVATQTDFCSDAPYSRLDTWYKSLTPQERVWVNDNWSSLMERCEAYLQDSVDEMNAELQETEEVLEFVERVDDLLDYTTLQVGQEGWTEAYRQYCRERPLESLPKFPAEGFRIYAPTQQEFTTEIQSHDEAGDRCLRETNYFKTSCGGANGYAETGYFITHYYTCSKWGYDEVIFQVNRKPLESWKIKKLDGAEADIVWDKNGKPLTIRIKKA